MKEHYVDLATLSPNGKAKMRLTDGAADVWTTHSITDYASNLRGDSNKRHCVSLDGKYRLPFRVDMSVRLDFPALILFVGNGHITFASSGQDNRRIEDIVNPSGKPNQDHYSYDNSLPFGEFTDVSVTYNFDEMQIRIGGEERFYSRKQAYMKAKNLNELNAEGFTIRLAVSKLSTLSIKTITVTEFDDCAPIVRGASENAKPQPVSAERPKPTFEDVISGLPQEFRDEVIKANGFLISLRPLKFKRTVDKGGGKITYVASDFGVSYVFSVSGAQLSHHFGWYIVYNGKPETWHRKADYMEETLAEIEKSDPLLAERIFYALNDCVGCYGSGCLAKTLYKFNGKTRLSCHGRVPLRMCREDFHDAREFFRHANTLMKQKTANGDPLPEKIFLIKTETP
jgi:hypothetical protein